MKIGSSIKINSVANGTYSVDMNLNSDTNFTFAESLHGPMVHLNYTDKNSTDMEL